MAWEKTLDTEDKARQLTDIAIASYNLKRPHQDPDGQTPEQVHHTDHWKQDLARGVSAEPGTKKTGVKIAQDYHHDGQPSVGVAK